MKADRATVMVASQNIYGARNTIAGLLGMKPEQVRVQFFEGAGCYGKQKASKWQDGRAAVTCVTRILPVTLSRTTSRSAGKKTATLAAGKAGTLKVTFKKADRYPYLCTLPSHAEAGMKGVLTVK